MGRVGHLLNVALLACALVLCTSCASSNVNPLQPRPERGYVDFYSPGNPNLYWEVKRLDPATGAFNPFFSNLKPLPDGVLRLELAPGPYQFQLTLLNRVIEAPLPVQFEVREGQVTPVRVELVPVGETSVALKQEQFGRSAKGGGHRTQYSSQAGTVERLVAFVQPPTPYRPKQQTVYRP